MGIQPWKDVSKSIRFKGLTNIGERDGYIGETMSTWIWPKKTYGFRFHRWFSMEDLSEIERAKNRQLSLQDFGCYYMASELQLITRRGTWQRICVAGIFGGRRCFPLRFAALLFVALLFWFSGFVFLVLFSWFVSLIFCFSAFWLLCVFAFKYWVSVCFLPFGGLCFSVV